MDNKSRRGFLAYLGISSAATATTVAVVAATPLVPESEAPTTFNKPDEYMSAMHGIGWEARAMFHSLPDGGIHRMGVHESGGGCAHIAATWEKSHAIQMRTPVQRPADYPPGDWWEAVWQYLYDEGYREDVSSPSYRRRIGEA